MLTVGPGGQVELLFSLFLPTLVQPADPDEWPTGPRVSIAPFGGGDPLEDVLYARRMGPGSFLFVVQVPADASFAAGAYLAAITTATVDGTPLVDVDGNPPTQQFTVLAPGVSLVADRFYATGQQLTDLFDLTAATDQEIRAAQRQLDNWMHRSLWPTVYTPPPFRLPGRNVCRCPYTPILQLITCEGGFLPGRRHTRWVEPWADPALIGGVGLVSGIGFQQIPVNQVAWEASTGHLYIPYGRLGAVFTTVRISVLAGYQDPLNQTPIGLALAQTIAWIRVKGFSDLKRLSEGSVSRDLGDSLIPMSAKLALEDFRVKAHR